MNTPRIVAFRPHRPWAPPGTTVTIEARVRLPAGQAAVLDLSLVDEGRVVAARRSRLIGAGSPTGTGSQGIRWRMPVPAARRHGYGLRLVVESAGRRMVATSALEAIEGWWQSPRHAAITELVDERATAAAVRTLADWHVTIAQHYDWMWRHYRYRPPVDSERFVDTLGREVSHVAVRAAIRAGHEVAIASLAYGSVYGAEPEHVARYPHERVFDEAGEPLSLGGTFFINDLRPGSSWRRRLLDEYRWAIRVLRFDGIHMDTYGRPHHAVAADGEPLDFAALYPGLVAEAAREVAATRPGARVLFNCVDGFPLENVARSPMSALYLELWAPDRSFADVVRWISRARAAGGGRAVIIAAYAAALRSRPEGDARARAFEASLLLGCVIAAAGGYHHTLAEGERILVEGYYPAAVKLLAAESRLLRDLWRFGARYLHLLSPNFRAPGPASGPSHARSTGRWGSEGAMM